MVRNMTIKRKKTSVVSKKEEEQKKKEIDNHIPFYIISFFV